MADNNKIGTYSIKDIESDVLDGIKEFYIDSVVSRKEKSELKKEPDLVNYFCNFPFYNFSGTELLFKTLNERITEKHREKEVGLYTVKGINPVKVQGSSLTKLDWESPSDTIPLKFVQSIYGGNSYSLGHEIFDELSIDKKGRGINDVIASVRVTSKEWAIHLVYNLCDLKGQLDTVKNNAGGAKGSGGATSAKAESLPALVNEVLNQYSSGKFPTDTKETIIISTSEEAAKSIISAIASNDIVDRSSEGQGETERRGNFTITYY